MAEALAGLPHRARVRRPRRGGLGRADAARAVHRARRAAGPGEARDPQSVGLRARPVRRARPAPAATPRPTRARCARCSRASDRGAHRDALVARRGARARDRRAACDDPRDGVALRAARPSTSGAARRMLDALAAFGNGARAVSGISSQRMAASSRARVARPRRRSSPERELRARIADLPRGAGARRSSAFDLIAEVKLRSPAVGLLRPRRRGCRRARRDATRGPARPPSPCSPSPAASTARSSDLAAGARALAPLGVPAMRKDFLVDPYQVLEGRAAGAGGVLVIVRMLPRARSRALDRHRARAAGCSCCSRRSTRADIELAHALVDARRGASRPAAGRRELAATSPRSRWCPGGSRRSRRCCRRTCQRVAESGVATRGRRRARRGRGYDLALVGSALMSAPDPACSRARCSPQRVPRSRARHVSAVSAHDAAVRQDLRHDDAGRGRAPRSPARSTRSVSCSRRRCGSVTPAARARARGAGAPQGGLRRRDAPSDARGAVDEILRDFEPDILQTDVEDFDALEPAARADACCRCCAPGPQRRVRDCRAACCSKGRVSGSGQTHRLGRGGRPRAARRSDPGRRARPRAMSRDAIRHVRPFGVDVSSGVESAAGHQETPDNDRAVRRGRAHGGAGVEDMKPLQCQRTRAKLLADELGGQVSRTSAAASARSAAATCPRR